MKHGPVFTLSMLLLAACSGDPAETDIVLTRQSREAQDWGRFLPDMYGGITACIAAHPAQPAHVTDAVPQNHGMILVRLRGADGSRYECSTGTNGNPAPQLTPTTPQQVRGPAFTPASMAEPYMRCGTPEPVLTGTGRLLGWLTHFTPDCSRQDTAAESGWRAFGNEPYWSLRIAGEDVIFDRLGEMPQRYAARPADVTGDRQNWTLDSPQGGAANRLELVITETACGDGMATRRYPYTAEARFQGRVYRGCAEKSAAIP